MGTLQTIGLDEANANTKTIFEGIQKKVGRIPNLYAAMGVSDKLLGGYLAFSEQLKKGFFSGKEYEVIALITSQVNECSYCISAHTALAKMQGLSDQEILEIRNQTSQDVKLSTLAELTKDVILSKEQASEEKLNLFYKLGYTKEAFAELLGIIALISLTNSIYHNGAFEIDFPLAPQV